ncbi:MAG: carbamoyltransferase HypF [Verrucomicrobia bacterium]|nr:carbamoyltransferase HypF [Verrucomicrobiota bacterium]
MTLKTRVETSTSRLRLIVRGAVQGVGFRPFVYRLANELGLSGWVNNSAAGVQIEVEGTQAALEQFLLRLETDKPPRCFIQSSEASWLDVVGYDEFEIRASEVGGAKTALVLPDIATCPDCLREIFDPTNRRHRYPFTNCTNCGPRFSIIEALPYDRAQTTMKSFRMCPECQAEYDDPADRRFHAQPNACPDCGPQLELWPGDAQVFSGEAPRRLAHGNDALLAAAHVIRCGQIVAVKGIGGFHLLVDARNDAAVWQLRELKQREEKPFALMFPTLESVKKVCEVSPLEERLLRSPEAPIVLLRRRPSSILHPPPSLSQNIAPGNPNLGVMRASNPLHHLLMAELGFPVVATSGNLSDEPICTDEFEALERLHGIADVFLVHNRPIVRHMDDSIVRVMLDREMVLRRARGYAPLPIQMRSAECGVRNDKTVLAVGAHLKNSVALAVGEQVFLSQHIGDLETEQANNAFRRVAGDLPRLYDAKPEIIAADLHPEYLSTKFALERGCPQPQHAAMQTTAEKFSRATHSEAAAAEDSRAPQVIQVQHHIAHVLSCIAENEVELPALGVAWDGTGYGTDGTIWGGEFFLVTGAVVERVAHLRPFRLPGGEAAVKEPRRVALGLIYEVCGQRFPDCKGLAPVAACSDAELATVKTMLDRGLNAPLCSSVGRLFDAVASLAGLRQEMRFEGQAAMELEFALNGVETDEAYHFPLVARGKTFVLDWSPMIEAIIFDGKRELPAGEISAKFHNALVEAVVQVATRFDCPRVALSGGCFQNRYLTERTVSRLREEGFQPYWHQRMPTNDGGIALGQIVAARRELAIRRAAVCESTSRSAIASAIVSESAALCGWSDGHSRAPLQPLTHHAPR